MQSFCKYFRIGRALLILVVLLDFMTVQAQETVVSRSTLIEQYKGKPCYLHFVKQGETINGIIKAYNVSKEVLIAENPFLQDGLKVDQVLRIPKVSETGEVTVKTEEQKKENVQDNVDSKKTGSPVENKKSTEHTALESTLPAKNLVYIVKKKETLYGISRQFNVTIDEIKLANPQLTNLEEGMELIIPVHNTNSEISEKVQKVAPTIQAVEPKSTSYKEIQVQQGQTLYSISRQYGITVEQFLEINPQASQGLKAEQIVKVPVTVGSTISKQETVTGNQSYNSEQISRKVAELSSSKNSVKNPNPSDSCGKLVSTDKIYEVALLLPFDLENADTIINQDENSTSEPGDFRSYDFFQFYCGVLLAADSLGKSGFRAHINVFDADKESDTLKIKKVLHKNNLANMDLVIGPLFAKSFDVASRYALKEKVVIVNPLSKRNKIISGNPYVYMAQPSDESMAIGMAEYIASHYKGSNIVICRNGPKEFASFAASFIRALKKQDSASDLQLREINYLTESFAGLTKMLSTEKHNVVLLFSDSRALVPTFVSLLNTANKNQDITLFGLPGWEDLGIETEFLERLDYHQVTSNFVDYNSEAVIQFIKQFRNLYSAEPQADQQAFLGFDIGWYFFQALMKYGTDFRPCLNNIQIEGLQSNFKFRPGVPNNGCQNSSYSIIQLRDYKFVQAK